MSDVAEEQARGKQPAWRAAGATVRSASAVPLERRNPRRPGRVVIFLLILAVLASLAIWLVPEWQLVAAREALARQTDLAPAERVGLQNNLFEAENAARGTLALIFAAAGLLLGLGVAWRRFELSRELNSHERFARAVEQLASDRPDGTVRIEIRLGGIYALERLLVESEPDYWPVMEVLTAYVRENGAWNPLAAAAHGSRLRADVQAVVGVIGRRRHEPFGEQRLLDLRETDLRNANLSGARLDGVTLAGAHLDRADATHAVFSRSNLREAVLEGATLSGADLSSASLSASSLAGARLNGARLIGADLSGVNLSGADLWEADLTRANLKDADLRGADLSGARLDGAILWRADLRGAFVRGTSLKETHLERANLSAVTDLTADALAEAVTDNNTVLPFDLGGSAAQPGDTYVTVASGQDLAASA